MKRTEPRNCGCCKVKPGEEHLQGCDMERCALCGEQLIGACGCVYTVNGLNRDRLDVDHPDIYSNGATEEMWDRYDIEVDKIGGPVVWGGVYPGTLECIEYEWFSRWVNRKTNKPLDFGSEQPGKWASCKCDDEDAGPDLNRLAVEARWNPKTRKYERIRP